MAMDPNDPSRLVAGIGRYSAFAEGGALTGLMLTDDGGATWQVIDDPLLVGRNISGVSINGDLILVVGRWWHFTSTIPTPAGGLFRSTDGGASWENIELFPRNANFPDEPIGFEAFDLVADPTDPQRYYAGVADEGIFRTDDGGVNWSNTTAGDPRISQLLQIIDTNNLDLNNMEMAVASNGRIYAAVITLGQPLYIGYSDSFGGSWTEMDIPLTLETTGVVGISPRPKAGGQGNIHFSIAADPNDPYTVYVGGDRQDGDLSFQYGNSIGARAIFGQVVSRGHAQGSHRQRAGLQRLHSFPGLLAAMGAPDSQQFDRRDARRRHAPRQCTSRRFARNHLRCERRTDRGRRRRHLSPHFAADQPRATGTRSTATCRSRKSTTSPTTATRIFWWAAAKTTARFSKSARTASDGKSSK